MRTRRPRGRWAWVPALILALGAPALGCFGTRLKVGLPPDPTLALAAYTLGYYMEDHAGVESDFVTTDNDPRDALADGTIDLAVVPATVTIPTDAVVRPVGDLPGVGGARVWVRPDVIEDLRFTLVDRALGTLPGVLSAPAFQTALAADNPRQAARKLVLDAP